MSTNQGRAGAWLVRVRAEPAGGFTAEAVGLPEVTATAATREEAVRQVQLRILKRVTDGRLDVVRVAPPGKSTPGISSTPIDPNSPEEQVFLKELARLKREDLEQTLRQYAEEDGGCSDSSSTP